VGRLHAVTRVLCEADRRAREASPVFVCRDRCGTPHEPRAAELGIVPASDSRAAPRSALVGPPARLRELARPDLDRDADSHSGRERDPRARGRAPVSQRRDRRGPDARAQVRRALANAERRPRRVAAVLGRRQAARGRPRASGRLGWARARNRWDRLLGRVRRSDPRVAGRLDRARTDLQIWGAGQRDRGLRSAPRAQ
jgi:hypothetical protein